MRFQRVVAALLVAWLAAAVAGAQQAAPPEFDALLAQAMRLHQAGDVIGAINAYQAALRVDPNRGDARSNLGAAYVRLGRFAEAIDQYTQALRVAPDDLAIQFNLALAYYKAAQFGDAVPLLERAVASASNPNAVLLLADSLLQQGEEQRVIDLLEPRAASYPEDLAFGYLLGTALVRTGQRDRGQVYMDRIFKAGESAEARLLMGTALIQAKDYPGAIVEFKKAVELNPQLATARTMYGRALMAGGDSDAAAREFLRALQVNPNDFDANLQLGALRKRDQQNAEARIYLERAVRLRPKDPTARFGLAGVEMALNRNEQAKVLLEPLVADVPTYEEAHVMLATCYFRLKRKDDGDRHSAIAERLRAERQERQAKPPAGSSPAATVPPSSERP